VVGATDGEPKRHAQAVADAAGAMQGRPLSEQRALYKALSDAAIALVAVAPPSGSVTKELFVAYCPMAPGDGGRWLQTSAEIANPYFATSMKACGSIERRVPIRQPAARPATVPATGGGHDGHQGHCTEPRKDGVP
jgi:hypothetical protein